MAMWDAILRNDTLSGILIEDMGITVDATSQITFSELFTYPNIAESDDLRAEVLASNLTVNDGSSDLTAVEGVDYLTIAHLKWIKDNYWNKTELADTGGSNDRVDWSQIQNAPDFSLVGSWKNPVEARILGFFSAAPAGTEGDFYVDTDDDQLYKYVGGGWVLDSTAGIVDLRVIDLDSTGEHIFQYDSTAWVDQGVNDDSDAVIVNDDGDGRPSLYVFDLDTGTGEWLKIADADILTQGNTLDEAYDQGGAGVGRTVTADTGPVEFDASSGNNAPLRLTDLASAPTGTADGDLAIINGVLYAYDATRAKWLSVVREKFVFGRKGNTKNQWLNFCAGSLSSNNSGYPIPRDATIVSLSAQLDASGTANLRVRRNDVVTNISTLTVTASLSGVDNTVDVDLAAGDWLQSYVDNASNIQDPMFVVEIAFRP